MICNLSHLVLDEAVCGQINLTKDGNLCYISMEMFDNLTIHEHVGVSTTSDFTSTYHISKVSSEACVT